MPLLRSSRRPAIRFPMSELGRSRQYGDKLATRARGRLPRAPNQPLLACLPSGIASISRSLHFLGAGGLQASSLKSGSRLCFSALGLLRRGSVSFCGSVGLGFCSALFRQRLISLLPI